MSDQIFLLSSSGHCSYCNDKASDTSIIKCITCSKHYHAVCKKYDKNTTISLKSFHTMYTTAKPNFCWRCDTCLTKEEEFKVATVEEKIQAVNGNVNSLAALVQNLTTLVTSKPECNIAEIKQSLSEEINAKISEEFTKVKSTLIDEFSSMKSEERNTINVDHQHVVPTVWEQKDKVKEVRTSLLVKRNNDLGRSVDINQLEQTAVDNGIPVNSVHVTESGDTFINFPDIASRDRLQPLLAGTDPSNEIITLKSKLPSIALLGVTQEYSKVQITNMIMKQNEVIRLLVEDGSHLSVLYTKPPGEDGDKPYHQVVLRVSPDIRRAISNHGNKIHMGKLVHRVVDRFYIRRCNLCQTYGHYQDSCPHPASTVCGYCAEETHLSRDCPKKSGSTHAFSCYNCKSRNLDHKGHSTFWHNCPSYKDQQKRLERTINYDYSN